MKPALLLAFALLTNTQPTGGLVIDFGSGKGRTRDWGTVTDTVMGGLTTAQLNYTDSTMVLTGDLSLKNYGGFAAVRSRYGNFDLSQYKGVTITYKASNQRFAFSLDRSQNWTQPTYRSVLSSSQPNTWVEETLFFNDFKEYQIGEPTGRSLATSQLSSVIRIGFISTEKKEGPFNLEIAKLEFVK
jgi:monofunctional biosynthetic peptidoglycan transglycosylase